MIIFIMRVFLPGTETLTTLILLRMQILIRKIWRKRTPWPSGITELLINLKYYLTKIYKVLISMYVIVTHSEELEW